MGPDPISLVEGAYDLDAPEPAWLQRLAEDAISNVPGSKTAATCFRLDLSNPAEPAIGRAVCVGVPEGFATAFTDILRREPKLPLVFSGQKVYTASEKFGGSDQLPATQHGKFFRQHGFSDSFGCIATDAEQRGLVIGVRLAEITTLSNAMRARWSLLAAHVAAAQRLRTQGPRARAEECVLSPAGRAVHAEGSATAPSARERLREAVVARDRARTRRARAEPDEALALWPGLVCGRWSLVDRFERDGRRYVVARPNEPQPGSPFALTLRERQVLAHRVQGDSVKLTAYALGLTPTTISQTLRRVLLKLGVRSVAELMRIAAPGTP